MNQSSSTVPVVLCVLRLSKQLGNDPDVGAIIKDHGGVEGIHISMKAQWRLILPMVLDRDQKCRCIRALFANSRFWRLAGVLGA